MYVYKFTTATMYSYVVIQSCKSTIGKEHVIDFKGQTKESVQLVGWHEAIGFFVFFVIRQMP